MESRELTNEEILADLGRMEASEGVRVRIRVLALAILRCEILSRLSEAVARIKIAFRIKHCVCAMFLLV